MPGEVSRSYEAPDDDKPLMPPWEQQSGLGLVIGDEVAVIDEVLEKLRRMCTEFPPNHYGTVSEILEDGTLLILFPDGQSCPYPSNCVAKRT